MSRIQKIQRRIREMCGVCGCLCLVPLAGCSEGTPEPQSSSEQTSQDASPAPTEPNSESTLATTDPALSQSSGLAPIAAGLEWTSPDGWELVQPSSPMRAAMYVIDEIECIFFSFSGGGSVEDNINRWASQVLDEQGQPSEPSLSTFEVNGLSITTVALHGTYMSGMPGGGERTPEPGSLFLGAIIENGPQGSVYIRMVGPSSAMDELRESWETLVRSLQPAQT